MNWGTGIFGLDALIRTGYPPLAMADSNGAKRVRNLDRSAVAQDW